METAGKTIPVLCNELTNDIRSLALGKDDVLRLLDILEERTEAAKKLEIENFQKLDQSDEAYEQNKRTISESFRLQVVVTGTDGCQLIGPVEDSFRTPNFPEEVKSIFVGTDSVLEGAYKYHPRNFVHVFLDFSKPYLLDFSLSPSAATPNGSLVKVRGYDSTWVHGVFSELTGFINSHPAQVTWVHRSAVYDLLLWLVGLPFGFWICYRLSAGLRWLFADKSSFLLDAAYVYIVLVSLFAFLLLFRYVRWVFPLVEYTSSRNKALKHRVVLGAIVLAVVGTLIYDILKAIF